MKPFIKAMQMASHALYIMINPVINTTAISYGISANMQEYTTVPKITIFNTAQSLVRQLPKSFKI